MLQTLPRPSWAGASRRTGSFSRGLTYERKVGRWLHSRVAPLGWTVYDHPWLVGPCQPDFVLESPGGCLVVVEAKLTQCDCEPQFNKYRRALGRPTTCVQICRRLVAPATARCWEDWADGSVMLLWL